MLHYLVFNGFVLITAFFETVLRKKNRYVYLILFLASVLLAGYRGSHGVDTENYLSFFSKVGSKEAYLHDLDLGFLYLSIFVKWLYNNEIFYFLCLATISIGTKMLGLWKLSPLPVVSLLILFGTYFLPLETNQIRQGLALGLTLFSINYILQNRKLPFILCLALASSFHVSAIVFFPAWWLLNVRIKAIFILLTVLVSFLFVFVSLETILVYIIGHSFFWNEFIFFKIMNYADKMEKVGFSMIHLWYIFISSVFLHYRKNINTKTYNFLLNIFVIGIAMNFFLNSFSYMIRITYYFLMVECILIGIIIHKEKHIFHRLLLLLLGVFLTLFKEFRYYFQNIDFYR